MNERYSIPNLVLEVTRRCNMHCDHCLRGDSKNDDMRKETIDKLLDSRPYINQVTFTGGEPTLNLEIIKYFFDGCESRGLETPCFYVVTNGKENQEELAMILLQAYSKISSFREKEYICGVTISHDRFHDYIPESTILEGLSFYSAQDKTQDFNSDTWVINRGRAKDNELNPDERNSFRSSLDEACTSKLMDEMLYISCDELLFGDCDMSYTDMKKGFIHLDDLIEAGSIESLHEIPEEVLRIKNEKRKAA